jgi:hypothetical protein
MNEKNDSLDDILKSFEIDNSETLGAEDRGAITIWIPKKYEERYKMIQEKSNKKFSKTLRKVVMTSIDKVDNAS